jgi:hypothetical protein
MKNLNKYIRVGTEYLKEIEQPLISGDALKTFAKWNKQTIIDDFGKDAIPKVKRYEGFCTIPSHLSYNQEINNFLNKYESIPYDASLTGEWKNIHSFLEHIFEEQLELGLDYLTLLWKKPTQILPVFCLVSIERNTGKSTFLKFLKAIFAANMTINKNEDFRSRFNSDWSAKLIIAVDEVLLDKREDSERLKNLSTSNNFKSESKGIDKTEIEFFGKFILCSNDEENFIKTDKDEIRYWVRKINPFEQENPDLLEIMKLEIPFFLNFLTNREIKSKKSTRMWFTKEEIHTEALNKLVSGNKTSVEKEIQNFIIEQLDKFELNEIYYTSGELLEELKNNNIRASKTYVTKILKENFKLSSGNSCYKFYYLDLSQASQGNWSLYHETRKGRFYTFRKEDFSNEVLNCGIVP